MARGPTAPNIRHRPNSCEPHVQEPCDDGRKAGSYGLQPPHECLKNRHVVTLDAVSSRRNVDDLQRQIQELFNDLWKVPRFSGLHDSFRPNADCYRTDDPPTLHVVVELAGVDAESIQVLVAGRTVIVAGNRQRPYGRGARIQQLELDYGPFERQIQLNEDIDGQATTATYERGLLEIALPIVEAVREQASVSIEIRRPG